MTRDDIIRMAREAGFETRRDMVWVDQVELTSSMERFAALVAAAEREACIRACEEDAFEDQFDGLGEAVQRIQARGET